jgi:hypothetical protein
MNTPMIDGDTVSANDSQNLKDLTSEVERDPLSTTTSEDGPTQLRRIARHLVVLRMRLPGLPTNAS